GKPRLELWPAWLLPLSGPLPVTPGPDGILARCDWQPEEARQRGRRQFVIRSGEQLAQAMRITGPTAAETATTLLARRLNVPAIDWNQYMVLCVSAGLQGSSIIGLAITEVKEQGTTLRVTYRLVKAAMPSSGFGYPAQTVLVKRSTAELRFEQETAPPKR